MLENSPEWAGVLAYNEFTGNTVILKTPPDGINATVGSEPEDYFDTEVVRWFERARLLVKPDLVRRVVDVVARNNTFHPVREYLAGLPSWDGIRRIGTWLIDYCGVESSDERPNNYAMAIGEKFLLSAVKRILEPGVKCDYLPVLEGVQGLGKSLLARIMASDEFFPTSWRTWGARMPPCNCGAFGSWSYQNFII